MTAPVTYRTEWPRRKGHYVAAIRGKSGDRFGLDRDFCNGVHVKTRHAWQYDLAPGWYERQRIDPAARVVCPCCGHRSDGKVRDYFGITPAGEWYTLPESAWPSIDVIAAGPLPGEDGSYDSPRCACGADVAGYTREGMPYCERHAPADTSRPGGVAADDPTAPAPGEVAL